MATMVTGEKKSRLRAQLGEIANQVEAPNGYPYDPEALKRHLQAAIEGQLGAAKSTRAVYWGNWIPDPDLHRMDDPVGQAIYALLRQGNGNPDVGLWVRYIEMWLKQFPGKLLYITQTPYCHFAPASEGLQQLRLWFGPPKSYGESHVDSRGHLLVAGANLLPDELSSIVGHLLNSKPPGYYYEREFVGAGVADNIKVWKLQKSS